MAHDPVRVVIVGCGGVGGWLANFVAPCLEYGAPGSQLILVDGDAFEPKNKARQKFSKLGNKAQVLRGDLMAQFPNTIIIGMAAWLVSEGKETTDSDPEEAGVIKINPSQLLQEGDFVFPTVDNFAARALLFNAAKDYKNIDVLTAGNEDDLTGSSWHYCRRDGRDITAHPEIFHEEVTNPPDRNPGELSCAERAKLDGGTQVITANVVAASLLLAKVTNYILGTEAQRAASLELVETHFDWALGQALSNNWPADEPSEQSAAEADTSAQLVGS